MQRTTQRENAFQLTIRPNSNSEAARPRGEARWDDETIPVLCPLTVPGGVLMRVSTYFKINYEDDNQLSLMFYMYLIGVLWSMQPLPARLS
uniref:Uncharacterized protein n=1 Tax=mine drainage metagenome TaxID=410659 RepID=E6PMY2_9ZZZZ